MPDKIGFALIRNDAEIIKNKEFVINNTLVGKPHENYLTQKDSSFVVKDTTLVGSEPNNSNLVPLSFFSPDAGIKRKNQSSPATEPAHKKQKTDTNANDLQTFNFA